MQLLGNTIKTLGELMVAYMVVSVHTRVWKEHKIDKLVFVEMEKERRVAIVGIAFIIVGFLLENFS